MHLYPLEERERFFNCFTAATYRDPDNWSSCWEATLDANRFDSILKGIERRIAEKGKEREFLNALTKWQLSTLKVRTGRVNTQWYLSRNNLGDVSPFDQIVKLLLLYSNRCCGAGPIISYINIYNPYCIINLLMISLSLYLMMLPPPCFTLRTQVFNGVSAYIKHNPSRTSFTNLRHATKPFVWIQIQAQSVTLLSLSPGRTWHLAGHRGRNLGHDQRL